MHQNALLIEEVTAFIRDFEHGSQLEKNHEIIELIDKICEHENQHGIGTIEEQTDWVLCLVGCSHNDILEKRKDFLREWITHNRWGRFGMTERHELVSLRQQAIGL